MTHPRVSKCSDGHFRHAIYSLGPYIADYPEQALLAYALRLITSSIYQEIVGFVNTPQLCKRRVHCENFGIAMASSETSLSSRDLQRPFGRVVVDYINTENTAADAARILADIDRRIAAAPPFPGLRRFPKGVISNSGPGRFKALMKVFLPAIVGRVPDGMVAAIRSFTEFCYLAWRSVISEDTLTAIETVLEEFNTNRQIFKDLGIRADFNLPRQHAIFHYPHLIANLDALMAFVHQSLRTSISKPSRNHGVVRVGTRPCGKYC
ncbi:C2H2-type domain-containing protein [Salix suchowensis]|nr:C2H2-type domain-containing protein [Salix suchowensis]